jgi:hypothetical protein
MNPQTKNISQETERKGEENQSYIHKQNSKQQIIEWEKKKQ